MPKKETHEKCSKGNSLYDNENNNYQQRATQPNFQIYRAHVEPEGKYLDPFSAQEPHQEIQTRISKISMSHSTIAVQNQTN